MRNTKDHGTHMLSIAVGSFAKGRRAVGMRRRLQGRLLAAIHDGADVNSVSLGQDMPLVGVPGSRHARLPPRRYLWRAPAGSFI